jgi:hypothetical protein
MFFVEWFCKPLMKNEAIVRSSLRWVVKIDARDARKIFSAKGAITGRQIVVPHFGFAPG